MKGRGGKIYNTRGDTAAATKITLLFYSGIIE